ncbi:hypothetical protein KL925_005278 [Ogataea polymorpha]|nr:hypothetical protein KL925_005278 [Ogataea polymorpha]
MSDLNVDDLPKDWLELSRYLHKNAHDFSAWEQLVNVALNLKQDAVSSRLVAISYENLLVNFPYCEQYWCNYADYLFHAGRTDESREIYERGVEVVPKSIVIWTKYLDFVVETVHQYDPVVAVFERARTEVGMHFYAHLLYDRYLQFLKAHRKAREYHCLLRRVIEVPLYHYSKYIKQFFKLIENADLDSIKYLITKEDLRSIYKLSWSDLIGRKDDKVFADLKKDMRKRYMDIYITTQYNVFQLWPFEEAVRRPYFAAKELERRELHNWNRYLEYCETLSLKSSHKDSDSAITKNTRKLIDTVYGRCLIATAYYPFFWIKYSNYYLNLNQLDRAKKILVTGIYHCATENVKLRLRLADLEVLTRNLSAARTVVLDLLQLYPNSVQAWLKLLQLEHLAKNKDLLQLVEAKLEEVAGTEHESQFDYLFLELLQYNVDLEPFLLNYQHKTSYFYWKACIDYYYLYSPDTTKLQKMYRLALENLGDADRARLEEYLDGVVEKEYF